MMCQKCGKNPATTHVRTVVNGVVHESNLCAYCAAKEGYGNFGQLSLANMLASMFGDSIESGTSTTQRCKCCGASFSDIVESGRVGCSECYETFRKELMPSLNRLHGKALHVGKIPAGSEKDKQENRIKELREKLAEAVKQEEFEAAAKLRDEIKALEKEAGNNA